MLPTADDPIPPILPATRGGNGQEPRYGVGDEGNWRPDGERAKLVTKQPGLVRALTEAGFATRPIPPGLFARLRLFYERERVEGAKPEWEKGGPRLIVDPTDRHALSPHHRHGKFLLT